MPNVRTRSTAPMNNDTIRTVTMTTRVDARISPRLGQLTFVNSTRTSLMNSRNRAINEFYEPGSTFKAILAAAALEHGVVRPDEMIFCENGAMPVGKWVIHDHHRHGWLSVAESIAVSSNIAAAKIGEKLGRERFHAFLTDLGLGKPTGVDLPAEVGGMLRPLPNWSRINLMTTSFGQGIAVTPLQMARAFAAIANGGVWVQPHLVQAVLSADNMRRPVDAPTSRRVISAENAAALRTMLEGVVRLPGATGHSAALADFRVAGKTGTGRLVKDGQYQAGEVSSFIGMAPADAPRYVIAVFALTPGAGGSAVTARAAGNGRFLTEIGVRGGTILVDEPESVGGAGAGPTPFELLSAALAACTSMTLRLYAERKGWTLPPFTVEVAHSLTRAEKGGRGDRFERVIAFAGPLEPAAEAKLLEIADKCPVHRTLTSEVVIETRLASGSGS